MTSKSISCLSVLCQISIRSLALTSYRTFISKSPLPRTQLRMAFLKKCFGGCLPTSNSKKQPSTSIDYLCHRFALSQLRKSTGDFGQSHTIGKGRHGLAYRASIPVNGQRKDVAVKRLGQQSSTSSDGLSLYKNEIIFMCQLNHPNLMSLVGFCDDKNEMIAVYEYAPNKSLRHQLYEGETNSPIQPWKKRLGISIGVARGLHYLHSGTKRIIIHRHVTPASILLGENWVPKLSYFGFSLRGPKFSAKDAKPIQLESVKGPKGYMAPECLLATNVTYKSDVYSFGVILLELICGKTLSQISEHEGHQIENANAFSFTVSAVKKVRDLAERGNAKEVIDERLEGDIAKECWKLYMDIIESCLSEDPSERPDMGEVEVQLEHILQLQEEADSNHGVHAFLI